MRICDVHPGVGFIRFNIYRGVVYQGTFLTGPMRGDTVTRYGQATAFSGSILIAWANLPEFRRPAPVWLTDMGIINWAAGYWDPETFTVKANKEHLLPVVRSRPLIRPSEPELQLGWKPLPEDYDPGYGYPTPSFQNFRPVNDLPPITVNPDFGAAFDYMRSQQALRRLMPMIDRQETFGPREV